ncbi:hypothetical protein E3T46_03700 [Cryobacterium sp. Hh11]|uniref:hypothetical protein n=1 Tax=Cryobacterium sp. Hh11 TaxID=2555868 RepID=UPI00106A2785|nr:hypothetical protein [Cryobacterium sp. Hh11]TFD53071.1 hypothetical protein E3T46_03700 [Cryobacterium sp. Hh11]
MSESTRVEASGATARPRRSRSLAAVAALLLGCAIVLAGPVLATAQATPESTPESTAPATEEPIPNTTTDPATTRPLIESPGNGQFIGSNRTTVSGSKALDQEIQLLSPRGGDPLCIVDDKSTSWSCSNLYLQNGPTIKLRVVVTGDSTLSDEITVAVLGAPTVQGGRSGSESDGWVRGTGHPQATVTASLGTEDSCSSDVDNSGAWACLFEGTLKSGSREVTASQRSTFSSPSSSNSSEPVTIVFDLQGPAAPVVTTPREGAQVPVAGTEYTGTGETGATVTVFAGAYSVCTAEVTDGAWTCFAGGVAAGSYSVIAVQQDSAGNVGPGSTPVTVRYAAPNTATPTQSASETPAVTPAPSASASPSPDGAVGIPGDTAEPTPSAAPQTQEPAPEAAEEESADDSAGASTFTGRWDDPTRFALPIGPSGTSSPFPWLQAGLLALGALVLIALPLRMLAGTISRTRGGRPLWSRPTLAGRNRVREEYEVAPTVRLNRWLRGGAALVAAATFVMLSGPVVDQPAYLRLLVAVTIGLVLVNGVAILVPLWWSSRVLELRGAVRFLPRYLLLVAAAATASRVFDVHPALLFGLLGSVSLLAKPDAGSAQPTPAQRGQLAAVRVGALSLFAVLAWSLGALLPAASDFTTSLVAETVNTIVLASVGSAVLILVPIGHTSGRSILAWSPPIWTGLTVVAYGILFAALAPAIDQLQSSGSGTVLWIVAASFAALCASGWVWQRFVAPAQR